MISVVMPVYNAEAYIAESIDSILQQTYRNFEFIIVNDGSKDKTAEIIKSYEDKRIVFIDRKENKGIVFSLNEGLSYAKGDYIARMDADDISVSNRFELQIDFLKKNPRVDICGGAIKCFGDNNNLVESTVGSDEIAKEMMYQCCMAHPTIMMRKKVVYQKELYNQDYLYAEDYELWCRLLKRGVVFDNVSEVLLNYRITDTHISSKHFERQQYITNVIVLRNFIDKYSVEFQDKMAVEDNGVEYCCQILESVQDMINWKNNEEWNLFYLLCYQFALSSKKNYYGRLCWYWKMVPISLRSIYRGLRIIKKSCKMKR